MVIQTYAMTPSRAWTAYYENTYGVGLVFSERLAAFGPVMKSLLFDHRRL